MLLFKGVNEMKIADFELNIKSISDVQKGTIPPSSVVCKKRKSDCFVYILSGEAEYCFMGKYYTARKGDIIYLAYESKYSINVTDENYKFIFIDFFFDRNSEEKIENEIFNGKGIDILENSFEKIYNFWKIGDFSDKIYCKSIIYKIYSEIIKSCYLKYISKKQKEQIEFIAGYIAENIDNSNLSVESLSRMCGISTVHFRRIFSSIYHTSPIKFITSLKVKKAKELLADENIKISVVAEKCGFQNHYYFSKVFKSETNMTPLSFRKLSKNMFL